MRKVGASRQSATPSPSPGSASASMVGGYAMKRGGSGGTNLVPCHKRSRITILAGSRVPSRLSMNARDSPVTRSDDSAGSGTPAKTRSLHYVSTRVCLTLTQLQLLSLCVAPPAQTPTRGPLPPKKLKKVQDPRDNHRKRHTHPSRGTVDNTV